MKNMDYSVIIPVYNGAGTIWSQLNAIIPQVEEFNRSGEVIVVDNNSTDGIDFIISKYNQRSNFKIKMIKALDSRGAAYARNVGASQARGEILLFCDSDDIVGANWLRVMYDSCVEHTFVTGSTVSFVHDIHEEPLKISKPLQVDINGQKIITSSGGNLAITKGHWNLLGGMREDLITAEDQEIAIRSYLQGTPVVFVKDAYIFYRQTDSFIVGLKKYFGYGVGISNLRYLFKDEGMQQQSWKGALKNFLLSLGRVLRKPKEVKESLKNPAYFLGITVQTINLQKGLGISS